ncbi:MAG: cell division protein, partial [Dehalococcoidia bacterium]
GIHGSIAPFSLAVNTAKSDLMGLKTIPQRDRILVGQTEARGHGVGTVREVGAQMLRSGLPAVVHAVVAKMTEHIDGFLVVAGLGGGTGSGGAPVMVKALKELYDEPVYVLGILPGDDEGKLMAYNALQCVEELSPIADGILFFDNNLWKREGMTLAKAFNEMNHSLVQPLPSLLGAGEASNGRVGVKVVDAADIMNSWKGLSVLGFSEIRARTLKDKLLFFRKRDSIALLNPTLRCYTVIKSAVAAGLTCRCVLKEAGRGLLLISGPKSQINVEGFFQAKSWLEREIDSYEIRGGDYPVNMIDELRGIVLLSGFADLPRLQELRERTKDLQPKEKGNGKN